jgi:ribosomal-protein-alanine N-acetyltransferase
MPGYVFRQMNEEDAREVAAWHYEPPYDFYDAASDPDDLAELLDQEKRWSSYFSVLSNGEFCGFFCFKVDTSDHGTTVELGLGMRPDLTGRGLGLEFLQAGLGFARCRFSPDGFRLSVAAFNERAIKVYERAGFRRVKVFEQSTNGGRYKFLLMRREA